MTPHAVDLGSIKHVIDFSDDQSGRACDITNAEVAALLALCEEQAQELARRDEYEAVEGWRIGHRRASNPHPALDICDTDEPSCGPVFRRRRVSSEDVHREADDGN